MYDCEETLGVIFEKNKNNVYQLYSVCTVLYDKEEMSYLITSGEYEGSDDNDFDGFYCEGDDLFKNGSTISFEKCDLDDAKAMYAFPRSYIEKFGTKNDKVVYTMLAKKLANTTIHPTNTPLEYKVSITNSVEKDPRFSTNRIKKMLVSEYEIKNKDKNKISVPEIKFEDSIVKSEGLPQTTFIDINKIIKEISAKFVGQEEAITALVANIHYNQLLIDDLTKDFTLDEAALDSSKVAILLEGATGTGKTAIVKEIASKLDLPFVKSSINSFSETGYVGPSITDLLRRMYFISGKNIGKAERGIIFLDEVDKIANKPDMEGKDMKKGVQEELLGFISGAEYDVALDDHGLGGTIHFDTSKLTFILSGAWTKLREKKINEIINKKRQLGFGREDSSKDEDEITYTITAQDYIDDGLEREFFGRIKVLICTKTYDFDDLRNILLTSSISPLKSIERTVKLYGYKGITCTDEFIDEVCDQALRDGTGARGLQAIILGIQSLMLVPLTNHDFDLERPIELTTDLLHRYNQSHVRKYKRLAR